MPVTWRSFSEDLPGQVIQRGQQSHRAVSVLVVSASSNVPLAQGQSGLGSFQSLALVLFMAAKDDRAGRRIQIQPDDIPEFGLKLGIFGAFESPSAVRFKFVGRPNPLHRRTR
jgi:hypothetical protein